MHTLHPGSAQLSCERRCAISASGGFTEFADQSKVRLLRDGKVTVVNVKEVRKDPSKDIRLKPGDKIEVPQSFW